MNYLLGRKNKLQQNNVLPPPPPPPPPPPDTNMDNDIQDCIILQECPHTSPRASHSQEDRATQGYTFVQ